MAKAGRGAKYNLPKHLVVIVIVMCKCIITSILEKKHSIFKSKIMSIIMISYVYWNNAECLQNNLSTNVKKDDFYNQKKNKLKKLSNFMTKWLYKGKYSN